MKRSKYIHDWKRPGFTCWGFKEGKKFHVKEERDALYRNGEYFKVTEWTLKYAANVEDLVGHNPGNNRESWQSHLDKMPWYLESKNGMELINQWDKASFLRRFIEAN